MSEFFKFGGVDSRQFYAEVFELRTFDAPARSYDTKVIPGRNGTMLLDGNRYGNIEHSYSCIIHQNFSQNYTNFRNSLLSKVGYQRLEDSMHTNEYYMAYYKEDVSPTIDERRSMGKMVIRFERKPQRYLKSGEASISFTETGTINNQTLFDSKPLLRIYGVGTVGIGDNAITVIDCDDYVDVDCEMMEAYKGVISYNDNISIQNIDFPVLKPGINNIRLGSGITQIDITPRWYML